MRHRQEDTARADELPTSLGFNIGRYDACSTLDLMGWWACFQHRSMLRAALLIRHKSDDGNLHAIAVKTPHLEEALSLLFKAVKPHAASRELVDKNVMERHVVLKKVFHEVFEQPCGIATAIRHVIPGSPRWDPERTPLWLRRQFDADLRLPNTVLQKQFSTWLRTQQEEIEFRGYRRPAVVYTSADLHKWRSSRVLACIDLRMVADAFKIPLTHRRIGELLFPENRVRGDQDKMRRTVVPLADKLMSLDSLNSLAAQIESSSHDEV